MPVVHMWKLGLRGSALRMGLSKGFLPVFTRVSEKITENSQRLIRQVQPGIEPDTSHLPVLRLEALGPWWDFDTQLHHDSTIEICFSLIW